MTPSPAVVGVETVDVIRTLGYPSTRQERAAAQGLVIQRIASRYGISLLDATFAVADTFRVVVPHA